MAHLEGAQTVLVVRAETDIPPRFSISVVATTSIPTLQGRKASRWCTASSHIMVPAR